MSLYSLSLNSDMCVWLDMHPTTHTYVHDTYIHAYCVTVTTLHSCISACDYSVSIILLHAAQIYNDVQCDCCETVTEEAVTTSCHVTFCPFKTWGWFVFSAPRTRRAVWKMHACTTKPKLSNYIQAAVCSRLRTLQHSLVLRSATLSNTLYYVRQTWRVDNFRPEIPYNRIVARIRGFWFTTAM